MARISNPVTVISLLLPRIKEIPTDELISLLATRCSPRAEDIVRDRHGSELGLVRGQALSAEEAAEKWGVTRTRINEIEAQAFQKIVSGLA